MEKKCFKIKLPAEVVYILSEVILAFAVAMITATDFGVSAIVAPAYLTSLKVDFLTFGLAEYVTQAIVLVLLCIVIKRVKVIFLFSFITCLFYGAVLDLWRKIIPLFNPEVTAPESIPLVWRFVLFFCGLILTAVGVALCFHTYLCPQVYDLFPKEIVAKFGFSVTKFLLIYDFSFLFLSFALSFIFFGKMEGIGWGTAFSVVGNGPIIGLCDKFLKKHLESKPLFPKFAKLF